jgi:hypothetical protein
MALRIQLLHIFVLASVSSLHANTVRFTIPGTYVPNVAQDRYSDSGVLMKTSAASGLCIGDLMTETGFARQLFSCNFVPSVLTFSFVDGNGNSKRQKVAPTDTVILVVSFVCFRSVGSPWKVTAFDRDHRPLEVREGLSTPVSVAFPRTQVIQFFRSKADIASVEFEAPGGETRTSIQMIHFDASPCNGNSAKCEDSN